ncbi:MAG: OmpA family protein [Bacteroidales bacterium]|nr:OmpA family protein [Bacteroidales bacterium]
MKKTVVAISIALISLLLSIPSSLYAQDKEVLVGDSSQNWFIGLGGGVNVVFDDMKLSMPAPAAQFYFGKWFTPAIGFRAGYGGIQAKPAVSPETWFSGDNTFFNHYAHVDALWNLRNTDNYKENMVWSPVLYLQAGALVAHRSLKNRCWAFGLGGGFQNLFRVSKVVSLSVDLSAVVAPERPYRNYTAGRLVVFPTATVGLVFNLGKRFRRPEHVVVPDPNVISKLEAQLAEANDQLDAADKTIGNLKKKASQLDELDEGQLYEYSNGKLNEADAPAPTVVEESATPEILYFELGKTKLDPRELARLEYYAQHSFKTNQILLVTGGADMGTGSREVNERLSKQRAEYVKDILVKQFGYNPNLIDTKADVIPSDSPIKGRIVTIEVVK